MNNKEKQLSNFNKKTESYLCTYYHDNAWWSLTINAYDFKDAQKRSKKLGLQLKGKLMSVIPGRLGFLAKMFCFAKNLTQPKG